MTSSSMRLRLQVMMFLQYFINGLIVPIFSYYLQASLHFSGSQIGAVLSMSAASAFVAPLLGALVADRILSSERLYSICLLGGGLLMLLLSLQHAFVTVLLVYLAYMLVYGSTAAMSTVIALHHEPDAVRRFGGVRMWGTVGFVAAAWVFGLLWLDADHAAYVAERLPNALTLAGFTALVLGVYALTLPKSPMYRTSGAADNPLPPAPGGAVIAPTAGTTPRARTAPTAAPDVRRLFPLDSLTVFFRPQVALFLGLSFLLWTADCFYYFGAPLFLAHRGVPAQSIMPLLSIGQMIEVGSLAALGFLLMRFGFRALFMFAATMELLRYSLFAVGNPFAIVVLGVAIHGFCFSLFFGTAMIYLDTHSTPATRAGVQQLFTIVTTGLGSLIGNLTAGRVFDAAAGGAGFRLFWGVPAMIALCVLLGLGMFFRDHRTAGRRDRITNT